MLTPKAHTPLLAARPRTAPLRLLLALALLALTLMACPEPPIRVMTEASDALKGASSVSECAEREYAQAQAAYDEAQRLVEAGRYDDAALKANTARQLAERAREIGAKECERRRMEQEALEAARRKAEAEALKRAKLDTVYFDYDAFTLDAKSKTVLQRNVDWMRAHPGTRVVIEGHCDEQGATDYNLALGEKRADAVRTYMVQLGISADRLTLVSFGAEMPEDLGHTEAAHAKNRRAEFRIKRP